MAKGLSLNSLPKEFSSKKSKVTKYHSLIRIVQMINGNKGVRSQPKDVGQINANADSNAVALAKDRQNKRKQKTAEKSKVN